MAEKKEDLNVPCHCKKIKAISDDLKFDHGLKGTHDDYLGVQGAAEKHGR
jgi:hypothetical protein